jgi:hypothetical protein
MSRDIYHSMAYPVKTLFGFSLRQQVRPAVPLRARRAPEWDPIHERAPSPPVDQRQQHPHEQQQAARAARPRNARRAGLACSRHAGRRLRPPREKRLVLITSHRRENFGPGLENLCAAIRKLAENFGDAPVQFVYPVHLNPRVREPVFKRLSSLPNVSLLEPLDYFSMIHLLKSASLVLTDSGGIQEELTNPAGQLTEPLEHIIDDIAGYISGVAFRLANIKSATLRKASFDDDLKQLVGMVVDTIFKLNEMGRALSINPSNAIDIARDVQTLERQVDVKHRAVIVKALNEISSTKDLLLLKDALEGIEGMVDKCQEASDSFTILALSM